MYFVNTNKLYLKTKVSVSSHSATNTGLGTKHLFVSVSKVFSL